MKEVSDEYVVEVIQKFAPLSKAGIELPSNLHEIVTAYREQPHFICLGEDGKGGVIGVLSPSWLNPEILVVQELGWWVEPEYRGTTFAVRMLRAFEKEAKALGAEKVFMLSLEALSPDVLDKMYNKLGYMKLENIYIKEV